MVWCLMMWWLNQFNVCFIAIFKTTFSKHPTQLYSTQNAYLHQSSLSCYASPTSDNRWPNYPTTRARIRSSASHCPNRSYLIRLTFKIKLPHRAFLAGFLLLKRTTNDRQRPSIYGKKTHTLSPNWKNKEKARTMASEQHMLVGPIVCM